MPASVDEWHDQHTDRVLNHQATQLSTSKLLVTFTLALAGTLVATALQVAGNRLLDVMGCVALSAGFTATLATILLDDSRTPNRQAAIAEKDLQGLDDERFLIYLKRITRDAEAYNGDIVRRVKASAQIQIVLSAVTAILAAVSLLTPTA